MYFLSMVQKLKLQTFTLKFQGFLIWVTFFFKVTYKDKANLQEKGGGKCTFSFCFFL